MVCPLSHSNRRALAAVVIGGAVFVGLAYYYFYTKKSLGESFDGPTDRPAHLKKRKKRDKKKRVNSALNASSSSSPSPSENSTKTAKEPRRPTPTPTRRLPPSNADYPVPPTPPSSKIEKP